MRGPRTRQVAAINAECDRKLESGVLIDGTHYHSDNTFLLELLALVLGYQAGVLTGTQTIRTRANENIQMDAAQIIALAAAVWIFWGPALWDAYLALMRFPPEPIL
jgi:ABC-type antimicrobial peptide transport system permease subunit